MFELQSMVSVMINSFFSEWHVAACWIFKRERVLFAHTSKTIYFIMCNAVYRVSCIYNELLYWLFEWIFVFISLDAPVDRIVQVHTSLPPKVDGQLRCYLKLKVSHIAWLIPNSPDITHVRVYWWGEDGPGTLFRFFRHVLKVYLYMLIYLWILSTLLHSYGAVFNMCTLQQIYVLFSTLIPGLFAQQFLSLGLSIDLTHMLQF